MTKLIKLPLSSITTKSDNQPRKKVDVYDLAQSIETLGLLNPIAVAPADDGAYRVLDGHRRLEAFKQAFPDTEIDAILLDVSDDDVTEHLHALASNVQRHQLSESEVQEYTQMYLLEVEPDEISAASGISVTDAKRLKSAHKTAKTHGYEFSFAELMFLSEYDNDPDIAKLIDDSDTSKGIGWEIDSKARKLINERNTRALAMLHGLPIHEDKATESSYYDANDVWTCYNLDNPCGCEEFGIKFAYDRSALFVCGKPENHPERYEASNKEETITPEQEALNKWRDEQVEASLDRVDIVSSALVNATFDDLVPSKLIDACISVFNQFPGDYYHFSISEPSKIVIEAASAVEDGLQQLISRRDDWRQSESNVDNYHEELAGKSYYLDAIECVEAYLDGLLGYWSKIEKSEGSLPAEKSALLEVSALFSKALKVVKEGAENEDA